MNPGLAGNWSKSTLVAFLAVAELAGAALAQDLDASGATMIGANEASTKVPAAQIGKPEVEVATDPNLPGYHLAAGERVELIHLPTFSAAGSIEKGSKSLRLIGVVITEVDAVCGSGPDAWPCGRMARAALQQFIRGRSVACRIPESPMDNKAQCSVGGKDIGQWLVEQGWVRADGSGYADAEKTARKEKRGVWSQIRPELVPMPVFDAGPAFENAAVRAEVYLSTQSMILVHRGRIVGQWPVSTARNGKETPTGVWTAKSLSRHHRSHRYDNAPMPYSVFYDGDYAVHGTYQTGRLGRPASAGCVRLGLRHAAALYDLVVKEGLSNTLIVIRQ
jgi:endonuclease YncB( thermonuclease family)